MSEQISDTVLTGSDGVRFELVFTAEAEVVRGPLGRFIDLAEQIRSEGLDVPPEIAAVLQDLAQP
jgi:uncharacterized protein YfcZ (UPF0381/DUF406 family)